MSIITTFPGIRDSVVYPVCYEIILSAILSLFRFGDNVLFSLRTRRLELVGARKNRTREGDTCIFSRASRPTSKRLLHSYLSLCFQAPPQGTNALICKLYLEIK